MQAPPINEEQLQIVLGWVDSYSLSKPKKNLARDFSDGVLVAQIMRKHFPQWVQLHNYPYTNSSSSKYVNWKTLNQKVFKKLNFTISKSDIKSIIDIESGAIQRVLYLIYFKVTTYEKQKQQKNIYRQQIDDEQLEKQANPAILYARQLSTQLVQKDQIIMDLRDTVLMLEQKLKKMEELSRLKDTKIQTLMRKIEQSF